jgi:CheY-like chemotaxis protein
MEVLVGGGQTAAAEATPKEAVASASSQRSAAAASLMGCPRNSLSPRPLPLVAAEPDASGLLPDRDRRERFRNDWDGPLVAEEPESAEGLDGILLVVSPYPEDYTCLRDIFESQRWTLHDARTYREAMTVLCRERMPVVICESRLPDGNWKDILSQIAPLADAPRVIVTSVHAEKDLRPEVLLMGGYDVLSKPFDANETLRLVDGARREWQSAQGQNPMGRALKMTA